ncbi:pilus assembly protein [Pseudorhodoferax sp.]|uniref:pilus assembly protein n=1 Tax=Pseudorhodoferax sp. TaxID=1993553 RepID=UPI0039E34186
MKPLWRVPILGLLAWQAALAHAQWQPSGMAAEPALPQRSPRLFVAQYDPATGAGDLLVVRSAVDTAQPLWQAAQLLQPRRSADSREPRHIVLGAVADADRRGPSDALAARLHAAPLGAVLNALPWPVRAGSPDRPAMVYVGAHDGMLHGFDADDGQERFAYAPRGLLPRLSAGARDAAVDGPVFGGEAPIGPEGALHPLLVAGLGSGGRGFFVLDVNAPQAFAPDRVLADLSDSTDADIGQLFSPPVLADDAANRARHVVQLGNGRWALVVGNGYFSRADRPVLLFQYLDQARELARLTPCPSFGPCTYAGSNGLSMPRLLDVDGDGRIDRAYAGDLQGRLWRFDLAGGEHQWRVAHEGRPLFTACDAQGRPQPITTAPHATPHPRGGIMLVFGTGRHLRPGDRGDTRPQSIYGVRDDGSGPLQSGTADCARPAIMAARTYAAPVTLHGTDYYGVAGAPAGDTAQRGWWIDLPRPGQRVLLNPQGFEGYKVLVHSVVPHGAAGRPWTDGQTYLSVLNLLTGDAPAQPAFGIADGALAPLSPGMARVPPGQAVLQRLPGQGQVLVQYPGAAPVVLRTARTTGARAGWHERR